MPRASVARWEVVEKKRDRIKSESEEWVRAWWCLEWVSVNVNLHECSLSNFPSYMQDRAYWDNPQLHRREALVFAVVLEGVRPTIPKECPEALRALISECWRAVPAARPDFGKNGVMSINLHNQSELELSLQSRRTSTSSLSYRYIWLETSLLQN